jgi:YbbR domain-containing protein
MQNRPTVLRFVLDNLGWLLGSILLSTIVWYIASSAQNPVEQRRLSNRIDIQVQADDGVLIVNESADTAQVTVRAPRSVFDVLSSEDISVVADLTKYQPGKKYTVPLQARLSDARRGVITDIQPSQITVELARRSEHLVNIVVVRTAEPPPGFNATETLSVPNAKIVGPDNVVNSVVTAQARINLQDQRAGFARTVPLIAVDANNKQVSGVTIDPVQVTVTVDIQPRPDVTELAVVPRLTGDLPSGYFRRNYSWDPKTVVVRGDRTTIENLNGVVSTDSIDLTGKTQTFSQRVKLALPTGVTTPDPVEISVTVEIEAVLGSREFTNIPVQTQGLDPADYAITVQPDHVNVIVNGPQPVLDALVPSDISVIAPLTGLSAGKYPVTLQGSITKPGISNQDILIPNAKAEVTIIALHPTATPTAGPTRTPTEIATQASTATP